MSRTLTDTATITQDLTTAGQIKLNAALGGSNFQLQYNNSGAFGGLSLGTSGNPLVSSGSSGAPYFASAGVWANSGTNLAITAQTTTDIPLVAKGIASQSGDLQQWQNSSGTALAKMSAAGGLIVGGGSLGTPGLRFSTDTSSGIYQDSGGVVRVSIGGARAASFVAAGVQVGPATSSASAPALTVDGAGTGGLFSPSSGIIGICGGGNEYGRFTSSSLTMGVQQTAQGSLILANTAAGAYSTTIKSSNSASAAWTFTLPPTGGTNAYVLQTDGSGTTSWVAQSGGSGTLTVNTTATSGATAGQLLYSDGSKLQAGGAVLASSLALGGAAIGSNALAVTGTALLSSAIATAASGNNLAVTAQNATDVPLTAKGAASQSGNLQNWTNSSGTNLVYVDSAGGLNFYSGQWGTTPKIAATTNDAAGDLAFYTSPGCTVCFSGSSAVGTPSYIRISSGGGLGFSNGNASNSGVDNLILREGAGILSQVYSTTAQTRRVYHDSSSSNANYSRATFGYSLGGTTGPNLVIGTEAAGTSTAGGIQFAQNGSNVLGDYGITTAGGWTFGLANTTKFLAGSTGSGAAALGSNCPASTATAPYTWIKTTSSDGSTVYIPAWK